jgi:curli biogenesis system outer membrane secretion channel CsgG
MKLFRAFLSVLFALIMLAGCATYIPIKIQRPAQLNIPPFKNIAVLDFDFTGQWEFWYDNQTPGTFKDLAKKIIIDKMGLDKHEKPNPQKAFPGSDISARLVAALVTNGHYTVLERTALSKILAEHSLTLSGMVDETKAAEVGRLLGVEGLILGSGSYSVSDGGEWVDVDEQIKKQVPGDSGKMKTVYETVKVKKFKASRTVSAEITYRIVNIGTGQVAVANTWKNSRRLVSQKDREEDACQTLPDWHPALSGLVDGMVSQTVRQIAPYYVFESREIKNGKSRLMKSALDYAKRNMIDDSRNMWEQVANDQSEKNRKDRVAALNNLAVYYEVIGDLDKAEELFNTCYQLSGKTEYLDNRAHMQARKREIERLKEQTPQ